MRYADRCWIILKIKWNFRYGKIRGCCVAERVSRDLNPQTFLIEFKFKFTKNLQVEFKLKFFIIDFASSSSGVQVFLTSLCWVHVDFIGFRPSSSNVGNRAGTRTEPTETETRHHSFETETRLQSYETRGETRDFISQNLENIETIVIFWSMGSTKPSYWNNFIGKWH